MPKPRWLDERESRMWRAYNQMRRELNSALERQLTRDAGLSGADYELLVVLSEAPGDQLRARELREMVGWDRSRLAHQIRRMEQRGLVTRDECPDDARGTVIHLTTEGRRAIESAAPAHMEAVRRHFVGLLTAEEIATLTSIADRVLTHLGDDQATENAAH
jgi:DNA-binding MarR family transcriptional regulator